MVHCGPGKYLLTPNPQLHGDWTENPVRATVTHDEGMASIRAP